MSNSNNSGGFAKAFLPGLVVGLVVGGFAGAFLAGLGGPGNVQAVTRSNEPIDVGPRIHSEERENPADAPASAENPAPPADESGQPKEEAAPGNNEPASKPAEPEAPKPDAPKGDAAPEAPKSDTTQPVAETPKPDAPRTTPAKPAGTPPIEPK
ncbi:MAG: hypothetical protein IT435_07680 [Phycisphaerales bacterium]|nr:hypothetical protein [Phycisphaerales bacterium]